MLGTHASQQFTALAGDAAAISSVAADAGGRGGRSAGMMFASTQRDGMPSAVVSGDAKLRKQMPLKKAAVSGTVKTLDPDPDPDLPEVDEADNPDSAAGEEPEFAGEAGSGGTAALKAIATVGIAGDYGDELTVSRTS